MLRLEKRRSRRREKRRDLSERKQDGRRKGEKGGGRKEGRKAASRRYFYWSGCERHSCFTRVLLQPVGVCFRPASLPEKTLRPLGQTREFGRSGAIETRDVDLDRVPFVSVPPTSAFLHCAGGTSRDLINRHRGSGRVSAAVTCRIHQSDVSVFCIADL